MRILESSLSSVPLFAVLQPGLVCVVAGLRARPQLPAKVGSLSARIRATSFCPLVLRLGPADGQILNLLGASVTLLAKPRVRSDKTLGGICLPKCTALDVANLVLRFLG
ncbi:uncharacterized protein CC84DRAFT_409473 [Paraphaeosphaeria sporulosa]|uniref:Uncharacterized protein n=1 Tax=Paraphaeosphaeria sporulosa TaxID=1460663 RepID=A0A177BUU3_9PLEO|nr:uncharacterized protein CC84DRAFT_409473 [Paraphaeosphaeria sporulosa]OAF98915.1 hypothetical protein CC84DRAFT_409473 [Paraphaeosphaeria sporulosa]